jgi:hypothetical protein
LVWLNERLAVALKVSLTRTIRPLWNHMDNYRNGTPDNQDSKREKSAAGTRGASSALGRTRP